MPAVRLSPLFNDQTITAAGAPASGYKVYTYAAGSSTLLATYTTSAGTVAQSNPIILDSNGYPTSGQVWLQSGLGYKFVLTDASGAVIKTIDNISGINDTGAAVSQWQASGVTPTYISATSFSLVGDQTTEFHVGRRLQFTVTAGTVYGTIMGSAYTTLTTVSVALDSGSLDSGLSVVNHSILRNDRNAVPPGRLINIQTFSTAGTSTYTPTLGTTKVRVRVQGGGGAGGGAASTSSGAFASGGNGGTAGAYAESLITSNFSGVTVTVGAGGVGVAGGLGGNGGTSSFGALVTAPGGVGAGTLGNAASGVALYTSPGSESSIGTGGNIVNQTGEGGAAFFALSTDSFSSGRGGRSAFGVGGTGRATGDVGANRGVAGNAATNFGAGGGAAGAISANPTTYAGGNGKSGIVIVEEYA